MALNDDKNGGMQAFLVVASLQPLPSYEEWSKQRGAIPWRYLPPERVVWRSHGETQDRLEPGGDWRSFNRGQVVELEGQPPLLQLCDWARGKDVDVVEALSFPVYP